MVNLLRKYKKYKQSKALNLDSIQCLSHEFGSVKNKIYEKLLLYYTNNNKRLMESLHSAAIYKIIQKRYKNHLLNTVSIDDNWSSKAFPKVIWWCWLQGEEQIPELSKICLHSLRRELPDYRIRIITLENLHKYVEIPKIIQNKYKAGWIGGAQFSDVIRLLLLAEYGGIWIDSTVYCTDNKLVKRIEKKDMFVYQNILTPNSDVIKMSNWLIATKKNNPYINEAARLLVHYYENSNYTEDYFICHLILTMLSKKYFKIWNSMDVYNNINPHMMQYMLNKKFSQEAFEGIISNASFHKLNRHIDFTSGDTFYNYLKLKDSLCEKK